MRILPFNLSVAVPISCSTATSFRCAGDVASSNKAEFKIFLTHQPQEFLINSALKNKYDLFLAGHTHGGQITLVFPFIQLTPTLIETRFVKGDFYFNDMLAVVCGGLGMSLAPVRYNSTPEIVVITLKNI